MKIKKGWIFLAAVIILAAVFAGGCSGKGNSVVTGQYYSPGKAEQTQAEPEAEVQTETADVQTDVFLITDNDMQSECIILEQLASGKQYMYYYSITTQFLDKYGNRAAVSEFEPGRVMTVGKKDMQGRLLQAQLSDKVWEYPNVTRYSVDEERGVFTIADTNYGYDDNLFIYLDGSSQSLSDLTELDTLRVVGVGRKILSISITTGHGELKLKNTKIFEGSYIQIGEKIFSEITSEMSMELPEGTYEVAVANNGYGGNTEIEIQPGRTTVLDLDEIKGDGPKIGSIYFAVDVADAVVQIDGKAVDYSQAVPIQYGVHTLTVMADSYDTYSKKLFVNSEKATIVVSLSGEAVDEMISTDAAASEDTSDTVDTDETVSASEESDSMDSASSGSLAGSLAGNLAGNHASDDTVSDSVTNETDEAELNAIIRELLDDEDDSTSDYLSTLTELLESLAGSGAE